MRFLRAQEERRTAVGMLLHVRLGQRSMWSLLDPGLLRMVLGLGLHNESDLSGDSHHISKALVLSQTHLAGMSLEQLKLLAVEREVKREGVGWAASCPPAGSKFDIFRAILRAQEASQDSQHHPFGGYAIMQEEDEDEEEGESESEDQGEEEGGEEEEEEKEEEEEEERQAHGKKEEAVDEDRMGPEEAMTYLNQLWKVRD